MSQCLNNTAVAGCYNAANGNRIPVIIHTAYDNRGAPAVRITDSAGVIVVGANVNNTVSGACLVDPVPSPVPTVRTIISGGANIASGIFTASHDPQNVGSIVDFGVLPLKLQSFSVTVLEAGLPASNDTVSVKFATTGQIVHMMRGQTLSWGIGHDDGMNSQDLEQSIVVECLKNSAATVTWTAKQ